MNKAEYKLSRNRYLELLNFCSQYSEWQRMYFGLDGWPQESGKGSGDLTSQHGIKKGDLMRNMRMVSETVHMVCPREYEQSMFQLVTQGIKPHLTRDELDFWYYHRKFYWELSKRRG